jgi:hypothetical protein
MNEFEKSVHRVGFIVRIYHDAWSHERQITYLCYINTLRTATCFDPCWDYHQGVCPSNDLVQNAFYKLLIPDVFRIV